MSWLAELEERREPNAIPGRTHEDWLRDELCEAWQYYRQPAYQSYLVAQARRHDIDIGGVYGAHLVSVAKKVLARTRKMSANEAELRRHLPTMAPKAQGSRGRPRVYEGCRIFSCLSDHHSHGYCNNCYRAHRKGKSDEQLEVLADKRMARTIPEPPKPEVPLLLRNHPARPAHPLHALSKQEKQQLMEQRIIDTLAITPLLGEGLRSAVTGEDDEQLHRSFGVALSNLKKGGIVKQHRDRGVPTYYLSNHPVVQKTV